MYVGCVNGNPRRFTDAFQLGYMYETAACFAEIDALFAEAKLDTYTVENLELEIFGESKKERTSTSNADPTETPITPSFAARLGKKIKELIRKIKDAIVRFTDMIRGKDREYEKVQAEIEKRMREDPSLKNLVVAASEEGLLEVKDIKSIAEFSDAVEKLSAEKNPKTFKEKFEAFKKKWDDPSKTKTASRVAFVTAAITLATLIYKFRPTIKEASDKLAKSRSNEAESLNKFAEYLSSREANEKGVKDIGDMNFIQLKMSFHAFVNSRYEQMDRMLLRDYEKVNGIMRRALKLADKTPMAKNTKRKLAHADLGVKIRDLTEEIANAADDATKSNLTDIRSNLLKMQADLAKKK